MSLQHFDKEKLKLVLRTSESFPTQFGPSQAKVMDGQLRPSTSGHPLSKHLRGSQSRIDQPADWKTRTRFCSLDDMAEALDMVLKTADGRLALQQLQPGNRQIVSARIGKLFDIEFERKVEDPQQNVQNPQQRFKFYRTDLAKAGFSFLKCRAVLEGRSRGPEMYLHVQTFYPYFDNVELARLLAPKAGP